MFDDGIFCHTELGIGKPNDEHHLTFHRSVLGGCLPLIRIYVGCAVALFGDLGAVDLARQRVELFDYRGHRPPQPLEGEPGEYGQV